MQLTGKEIGLVLLFLGFCCSVFTLVISIRNIIRLKAEEKKMGIPMDFKPKYVRCPTCGHYILSKEFKNAGEEGKDEQDGTVEDLGKGSD